MDSQLNQALTQQAKKVRNLFETYLQANQDIIDSSRNRKIVCAFGFTGSGKSTLLNLLCDKPLLVQDQGCYKQIALQNAYDPNNFGIGQSTDSFTVLPQYSEYQGIRFYDFAGLNDNRGVEYCLLNACYIKQIVEKASSVIFLFVVEQATLDNQRGKEFFDLIEKIKLCLPQIESQLSTNGLVITKAHYQDRKQFESYLNNQYCPLYNLEQKIKLNKFKFSKPDEQNKICYDDGQEIMNFLQSNQGIKNGANSQKFNTTKELFKYDNNKTALWQLRQNLFNGQLVRLLLHVILLTHLQINKKIVYAFGFTGSGKSTLLNLLCDKPLLVQDQGYYKQIAMQNAYDPNSFGIGQNLDPFTILPQYSQYQGIRFYDFTGLNDNRGIEYSLLIHQIIKKHRNSSIQQKKLKYFYLKQDANDV
ncbi:hypothetical protein ABPG74_013083 [Tetrahymena malaccensis]